MKKIIFAVFFSIALTGCGSVYELNNGIDNSINQLMGTYSAPTLASSPRPSGCKNDNRCRELDEIETYLYTMVRQKKTTWTKVVNIFYDSRLTLYPNTNDSAYTREFISFQKVLAEQMDAGKITEAQWAYLVDKKYSEIETQASGQRRTCNTQNVGTNESPNYRTICR